MHQAPAVVVGVDGSCSATAAALWAIDEAVSGDIPLRLLHAVPHRDRPTTTDDIGIEGSKASTLVLHRFCIAEHMPWSADRVRVRALLAVFSHELGYYSQLAHSAGDLHITTECCLQVRDDLSEM